LLNQLARQRSRRLPVFLLLDISKDMGVTFQITIQEGIYRLKCELASHPATAHRVYLSSILFNEQATIQPLLSVARFAPPAWEPEGTSALQPALALLSDAFTFDLIQGHPEHPGDYRPLVFLLLGSRPRDVGPEVAQTLSAFTHDRKPLIIVLATRQDVVSDMKRLSQHVLLLSSHNAIHMTHFFNWMIATVFKVCSINTTESGNIEFPVLPSGITLT